MRFTVSGFFAFATSFALVAAQDLSGVPGCAIPCFATSAQGSGCPLNDIRCQCTTGRDSIQSSLAACTVSRCSASELADLAPALQKLCENAGVTITDIPTALPSPLTSFSSTATSVINATASRNQTVSPTGSAPPVATTNAANGKSVVGYGAAVVVGLVGVLAL